MGVAFCHRLPPLFLSSALPSLIHRSSIFLPRNLELSSTDCYFPTLVSAPEPLTYFQLPFRSYPRLAPHPDPLYLSAYQAPIMRSKFKDEHPFEKRKAEAERIRQKYADRIPVSINLL